jgi:hypothetical protein
VTIERPLWIVDLSAWNIGFRFDLARQWGVNSVFTKVCEGPYRDGSHYINPRWKFQLQGTVNHGMMPGLYMFAVESVPDNPVLCARRQVDLFMSTVGSNIHGKGLMIDFEAYNAPYAYLSPSNPTLRELIREFRRRLGPVPLFIYSADWYWNSGVPAGPLSNYGANLRAWNAFYPTMAIQPQPKVFYQNIRSQLWRRNWGNAEHFCEQFTPAASIGTRNVDLSACSGTLAQLNGMRI